MARRFGDVGELDRRRIAAAAAAPAADGRATSRPRARPRTGSRSRRGPPARMARSQATAGRPLLLGYATDYRNRGRVRHLVAVRSDRESDTDLHAGGAGIRGGRRDPARQAHPLGLRGGVAAARRPRLRPEPVGRAAAGGGRRRGRRGQHDPDERRPALRRPRPSRVLRAGVHRPAGRGDLGQGRRTGDGGRCPPRRQRARRREAAALQEQRGRQGRLLRVARELSDVAPDAVLGGDRGPDAASGVPAGHHRFGPGRASGRPATSPASSSPSAPTTSRSRSAWRPRSSAASSTPATSRTPTPTSTGGCTSSSAMRTWRRRRPTSSSAPQRWCWT